MKRLFAFLFCAVSVLVLLVGCGENNNADKTSSQTASFNYQDDMSWYQVYPSPAPDHKVYTVYCLPTKGVKEGVALDPNTKVRCVDNIGNLYFSGFQNDSHIKPDNGTTPKNNVTEYKTEIQDDHLQISTFEMLGVVYEAVYKETIVTTESIMLGAEKRTYTTAFDTFDLEWWGDGINDDPLFAEVTLERNTGRIARFIGDKLNGGTITTKESARRIAETVYAELNGFDMPKGTELKAVNYGGYCDDYEILVQGYSVNGQECDISVGDYNEVTCVQGYINLQKYLDAIEYYGKESINEAIDVLMSSIDDEYLTDDVFLDFDGNGELYCRVYSTQGYNANDCWCSTRKQYCVKVIK